jgi:two-component system NarL family sensor kinase
MKKIILIILFCTAYCSSFGAIQQEIDCIKQLIKTQKTDSILVNSYLSLSSKYLQENNDSALLYAKKALALAGISNNLKGKTIALSRIGLIHYNLGDLQNALKHYNTSLITARSIKYSSYIAQNYKLIGALYSYEKDFDNALAYNYKALTIFRIKKDTINIARTYGNIAVYQRKLAKYDSSLYYLNLASQINIQIKNFRSLCFDYNNIGSIHLYTNRLKEAEEYYLKSLKLREEYGLTQDLLQSYNSLGNLHNKKKEYEKAIAYFNRCISIANEIKIIRHLPLFYKNLTSTYTKLGNYKLALESRKSQQIFTDSINNPETQIFIVNADSEIKKAEEDFQELKLIAEVSDLEKLILKKSILITFLILIGLIAVYVVAYSIKHYKLKESLLQQEVSLQAIKGAEKVISEKEISAQKINIAQEILTSEIATLLNTEVTLKLMEVLKELNNYKKNNPETEDRILKEQNNIKGAINFINQINNNLLHPILDDILLTEAISKYLDTVFKSQNTKINFTYNNLEIINCLEKNLGHNIYRIFQELITNIIKYSKATIIDIEISTSIDHLLLRVNDNGIGFDASINNKGLGLNNVKHRAQLYNGNIIINTKKGEGTEILINMDFLKV